MPIKVWPVFAKMPRQRFDELCHEAGYNSLEAAAIRGPRRQPHLVQARMVMAVRLRGEGYSLKQIGLAMNRDHTSIIHLLKKYGKEYGTDQN